MQWSNTLTRWGAIAKILHWGIFFLIISQYTIAYIMLSLPSSDPKWALFTWHKQIGATILLLAFFRLWWRLHNPIPRDSEKVPRWVIWISKVNIWILYGLIIAFPITGFLFSVLGGHPVSYFELFTIPAFMKGPNIYEKIFLTAHIWISYCLYFFVASHILGGFYHHFIIKDDVLVRMLPHNIFKKRESKTET